MNATHTQPALTLAQAKRLVDDCERLFNQAARAWERGNNSGDNALLERGNRQCDHYRQQAEHKLAPFGITVDYPGLYPSFQVNGRHFYDVLTAVSAALEEKP